MICFCRNKHLLSGHSAAPAWFQARALSFFSTCPEFHLAPCYNILSRQLSSIMPQKASPDQAASPGAEGCRSCRLSQNHLLLPLQFPSTPLSLLCLWTATVLVLRTEELPRVKMAAPREQQSCNNHPLTCMTRVKGSPGWCLIHFSFLAVENWGSA